MSGSATPPGTPAVAAGRRSRKKRAMLICDDGHDEVCFEVEPCRPSMSRGDKCPACVLKEQLAEANVEIKRLQAVLDAATA